MLDRIKLFMSYAKAGSKYGKQVIDIIHNAVNHWPVWDIDDKESKGSVIVDVKSEPVKEKEPV